MNPTKKQVDQIVKNLNKVWNMERATSLWENFPRTLVMDVIDEWERMRGGGCK